VCITELRSGARVGVNTNIVHNTRRQILRGLCGLRLAALLGLIPSCRQQATSTATSAKELNDWRGIHGLGRAIIALDGFVSRHGDIFSKYEILSVSYDREHESWMFFWYGPEIGPSQEFRVRVEQDLRVEWHY